MMQQSEPQHGLSDDFLRLQNGPGELEQRAIRNRQMQMQQQFAASQAPMQPFVVQEQHFGTLMIGLKEGILKKKPGLFRSDLYARIKHAGVVINSRSCSNSGKTPHWDEEYSLAHRPGVEAFKLEILDEGIMSDSVTGWAVIPVSSVLQTPNEVVEDWFDLHTTKDIVGQIKLSITYKPDMVPPSLRRRIVVPQTVSTVHRYPPGTGPGIPPQAAGPSQQEIASGVSQLKEMFPEMDEEIIRGVLENNHGNVEATANHLVQMQ
eukprot:Nk52_evm47s2657 gene=Nk52_evmTU47s2657